MDIKAKVTETVEKFTSDKKLQDEFKKDPVKAVESVIGVDLPDDTVNKVVDAVKVKLAGDKLGGIAGKLKDLL